MPCCLSDYSTSEHSTAPGHHRTLPRRSIGCSSSCPPPPSLMQINCSNATDKTSKQSEQLTLPPLSRKKYIALQPRDASSRDDGVVSVSESGFSCCTRPYRSTALFRPHRTYSRTEVAAAGVDYRFSFQAGTRSESNARGALSALCGKGCPRECLRYVGIAHLSISGYTCLPLLLCVSQRTRAQEWRWLW